MGDGVFSVATAPPGLGLDRSAAYAETGPSTRTDLTKYHWS